MIGGRDGLRKENPTIRSGPLGDMQEVSALRPDEQPEVYRLPAESSDFSLLPSAGGVDLP